MRFTHRVILVDPLERECYSVSVQEAFFFKDEVTDNPRLPFLPGQKPATETSQTASY